MFPAPQHITHQAALKILLHTADVSNPAKQWSIYLGWTTRIMSEFFAQGDMEKEAGIPVTPIFDRDLNIPLPKLQVSPYFKRRGCMAAGIPVLRMFSPYTGAPLSSVSSRR